MCSVGTQHLVRPWSAMLLLGALVPAFAAGGSNLFQRYNPLSDCPGYRVDHVSSTPSAVSAELALAGEACNVYGDDLQNLILEVTYETESRLHLKLYDAASQVYQVPESVLPRPGTSQGNENDSLLQFNYVHDPFSFKVTRKDTGEVLFDISDTPLVFESQYVRLRTKLPSEPNIYGIGSHTDPLRLNITDYVRTLWNSDAYRVPEGTNLYSSHPIYFDHRTGGTHGVFLLNSNGMDVIIDEDANARKYLEYNTIGGVLDLYFFSGPTPVEVSRQYAEVVGLPAMVPYWGFGFQQCRWGYRDIFEVAEVVANYSRAGIPLETMYTDIDYMDRRRVFSNDPERYPLDMMRELVAYLHDHDQKYILMVDPAIAYADYPPFDRAVEDNVLLQNSDGGVWKGVVWPGVTAFPDWFSRNIAEYWSGEFEIFFNPETGVDIDGLWIDMNEPANPFCDFPCDDPEGAASEYPPEPPPVRQPPRPIPRFPCSFQPNETACEDIADKDTPTEATATSTRSLGSGELRRSNTRAERSEGPHMGLPGRDLLFPKYAIHNNAPNKDAWATNNGSISNHTVDTDIIHQNGLTEYDTHNLYGLMMAAASRDAMLNRRPDVRPLIITRSSFSGSGNKTGHWLGDNESTWTKYRASIRTMLAAAAIYQMPMVGSDVCGFERNTTEELCARWAALGAFSPFYRNHNAFVPLISQEFYRWDKVAESAKKAIDIRYRLLDYIYTAFHRQSLDGTPVVSPMFFAYPDDEETTGLEMQYFYGPGILVAPATEEGARSARVYFPDDVFYDWYTHDAINSMGEYREVDAPLTHIPLFIRGGHVLPIRVKSGMTTTEVREQDFEVVAALDREGRAEGSLYLDDGESLVQNETSEIKICFENGSISVTGTFEYATSARLKAVTVLGLAGESGSEAGDRDTGTKKTTEVDEALHRTSGFVVTI